MLTAAVVNEPAGSCIEARGLSLGYGSRAVLSGLDLSIAAGEFVGVIGASGAGKSTLLMALNGTTAILGGRLRVLGMDVGALSPQGLRRLRARTGVIFQGYNLVGRLSVLDNVASGMLARHSLAAAVVKYYSRLQLAEIQEYLRVVGLEDEALARCDRLSGGQRQRVAIARAIAQRPELLLADEPIASLDPTSARRVLETLQSANQRYGITVVANLHQLEYAREFCTRVVGLRDGRLVHDGPPQALGEPAVAAIYRMGASRPPGAEAGMQVPVPVAG